MQQHDVNVTERIEFAPAISAESDQRERNFGYAISTGSSGRSSTKDVLQQNIDELSAQRANFPAAPTRLVLQTQPMLFNLEEFFVKWENLRRSSASCSRETVFRMRQNLFQMSGRSHRGLGLQLI